MTHRTPHMMAMQQLAGGKDTVLPTSQVGMPMPPVKPTMGVRPRTGAGQMSGNDHLTGPMLSASMDEVVWLRTCIEKLEAARAVDLQVCANQLEQNTATMNAAAARIEALEKALRKVIACSEPGLLIQMQTMRRIAAAALTPEQDK